MFPTFNFQDAEGAISWLVKAFGFEKGMVVTSAGDRNIAHAELRLGNGWIMLGSFGEEQPGNPWPTAKQGLYVYVEDVDAHYQRAKAAGADIFIDIRDTDYGSREYCARDLEGNLWSFGSYRPKA